MPDKNKKEISRNHYKFYKNNNLNIKTQNFEEINNIKTIQFSKADNDTTVDN